MSRIEWTRYNGDDNESVVAMFISGDYPAAERINPSIGDGCIDVLVKTDKTRVYQMKKFAGPLSTSQANQVKKSVDRLCTDPRVKDLQVDEWHLVMPWDATPLGNEEVGAPRPSDRGHQRRKRSRSVHVPLKRRNP